LIILSLILIAGIVGCFIVFKRNKRERFEVMERTLIKIKEIEDKTIIEESEEPDDEEDKKSV
jgi:hypothetical protein